MSDQQSSGDKPKEVHVSVPSNLRAATYANLINVNTTNDDVTLNFVYVNPQDTPQGTLVSRVVIPRSMLKKVTDLFVEVSEAIGR
jgi:hypothetical protein